MKINIEKGNYEHLDDCVEALFHSDLGPTYFETEENCEKTIREGLDQGTLYVAVIDDECAGFMWYIPKGVFRSFPYLHIISIKEAFRGKGLGKKLIQFLEEKVFTDANKMFLVVADFNADAKRLYESIGFQQVGELPNLYRDGVNEYLMMKEKGNAAS